MDGIARINDGSRRVPGCPPLVTLRHFWAGQIDDGDRRAVEAHAGSCKGCRKTLAQMTSVSLFERMNDRGDRQAWEGAWADFVRRYEDLILEWCRLKGVCPEVAKDIAQTVLTKLVEKMGGDPQRRVRNGGEPTKEGSNSPEFVYDETKKFRDWLREVVEHALVDRWRYEQRRPGSQGSGGTDVHAFLGNRPAPSDADVEELTRKMGEQMERDRRLRVACDRAFAHGTEKTKKAFLLRMVEGQSAAEVAEQLGISKDAVNTDVSRVRKRIKAELDRLSNAGDPGHGLREGENS